MPHISLKWLSGRSEEEKMKMAEALLETAVRVSGRGKEHFSVTVEDIEQKDWDETVYIPDIVEKEDKLYIRPGYGSLAEEE